MAKNEELITLLKQIDDARLHSRNLGKLDYREDEKGRLMIDFENTCEISVCWGVVYMVEDLKSVVYDPKDEKHPVKFIFNYFYDTQYLWVFPEQILEDNLGKIIDSIYWQMNFK